MTETADPIYDLEGNDVKDCEYCVAFQWRDWQTVEILSDNGVGCTCDEKTGD